LNTAPPLRDLSSKALSLSCPSNPQALPSDLESIYHLTATESAIPSIRILMVLLDLLHSIIGPRADPTLYRRRESPPQKSHLYHTQATLTYCHQISRTSTTAPPLRASVPEIASPWFSRISRELSSDFEVIRHCTSAERSVPWADSLRILVCLSTSKHLT
jgi:hypothetical protein